jgi:mannose-6-phosphate isomerase-like protein (cupin superfamily)
MTTTGITRRSAAAGVSALFVGSAGAGQAQPAGHRHQTLSSAQKEQQGFNFLALKMFVEVDSDDTKGGVAIVRVFVPPGAGAAPHVHSREDEIHTVVRGHYRYRHGDEEVDAPPGTTIFMPRGIPHTFRNVGEEPGEHELTLVPGGLEKAFREVSAARLQMPRDQAKYDEISAKYGVRNLPPDSLPLSTNL